MNKSIGVVKTTLPGEWNDLECGSWCHNIIEKGLAACSNRHKITSLFKWEKSIQSTDEWQIDFKTSLTLVKKLISTINEAHPYDIPMIISSSVDAEPPYVEWVESVCIKPN